MLFRSLAVYVLPVVTEFLVKNKRPAAFGVAAAGSVVTAAAFNKVHWWKPTTDIWGVWNHNYFKLQKGVWHEGQWIQGIKWYDWALVLDLIALSVPMVQNMLTMRKDFKEQLEA